jgi:hypothetical protein
MKHKTWFRLLLKAIGVAMLAYAIPQAVSSLCNISWWLLNDDGSTSWTGTQWVSWTLISFLHVAAQIAVGLYLLLGGEWIVNKCIPSNRPYCPNCGYDLSHNTGERCSECGVVLPPREAPPEQ